MFSVVLFSVISVVNGFTEIKKKPKWEKYTERSRWHPRPQHTEIKTKPNAPRSLATENLTHRKFVKWRLFIFISRESKWGTLKSEGNPRCAVPAESHSICTDRRRPSPAAALQVSPTSDTCQSVAILMNRPHYSMRNSHRARCFRVYSKTFTFMLPWVSGHCESLLSHSYRY